MSRSDNDEKLFTAFCQIADAVFSCKANFSVMLEYYLLIIT